MDMKERLIELLQVDMSGCDGDYYEELADYLLSHGVIVPPVKVGDVIPYECFTSYVRDIKCTIKRVKVKGYTFIMSEEPEKDATVLLERETGTEFWQRLDIFLLKCREAEKALEDIDEKHISIWRG